MAKEQFFISGSKDVVGHIDEAGRKAGLGRGQAFEDFLIFVRCSLAGQTMEEEYLATVAKGYAKGKPGKRGIDAVVRGFGALINLMEETGLDVLGDVFQGAITYGEGGQYFTPDSIVDLVAGLTTDPAGSDERKTVCDPACGSGRFLLAIGKLRPHWEFTGQDVDHRCTTMWAINAGLRGLFGWAVWQNSLTLETHRVFRIGFNLHGGVIREIPVDRSPFDYQAGRGRPPPGPTIADGTEESPTGGRQLDLF